MKRLFILILSLSGAAWAQRAQNKTARGIGSGILYASPNLSTVRNPTTSIDSPRTSFLGLYRFDPELAHASLSLGGKNYGGTASFRQELDAGTKENVFESAMGYRTSVALLGFTIRKFGDRSLNGDVALVIDGEWGRMGAVLRNISEGIDRTDAGFALKVANNTYFEIDVKSYEPFTTRPWLVDVGLVIHSHDWTLGLGYDFVYTDDGIENGEIHGGVSLQLTDSFYADGHYRLAAQEWNADQWSAGLRFLF